MPRARTNEEAEDVVLTKTRTRRARAVSVDTGVPAPRKRAAPRARVESANSESVTRKAPTTLSAKRRSQSKSSKAIFGVLGACVILSGVGVVIGIMDKGTIDVIAVVNERNEKISKGEVRDELGNTVSQTIQVQSDTRPNGGLPMGDAPATPPPVPEPEVSSTTEATSTTESESASSSQDSVDTASTTEEAV